MLGEGILDDSVADLASEPQTLQILQKMKTSEVVVQGHTASQGQSWDQEFSLLMPH